LVLTELGGKTDTLSLSPSPFPVDLARLTTDSVVLSVDTIPNNVQFTNMTMAVQNISVTIANGASPIGRCAPKAVCQFSAAPSTTTITATLFGGPLTPGADGKVNIFLKPNAQDIVTVDSSGLKINFSSASFNTVGSFALPRKGSTSALG